MAATHDPVRAAVLAGLAQAWDSGGRRFATFELVEDGRPDADRWVQWIDGQINLRWPFDDDPSRGLPARGAPLPRGAEVTSWTPQGAAVIGAWDVRIDDAADFVAALLRRVLARSSHVETAVRIDAQ